MLSALRQNTAARLCQKNSEDPDPINMETRLL